MITREYIEGLKIFGESVQIKDTNATYVGYFYLHLSRGREDEFFISNRKLSQLESAHPEDVNGY
ncbi:MAG TPA: hypothetical protein VJH65_03080 [Candidatus Nanoarchaeia archaeon]|nr:hypothetical protein [Candidatus Nanoarchaeia archaeon]